MALNLQQGHEPGTSNSDERTRKIWKRVWLLSITPKVGHFLFKCLHNSLATRENLFRRSIVDSPACFRCGAPMEYSLHILRDCTLSRSAWSILRPSLLAASTHNTDVMQWLFYSILSEDDNVAEFGNMITWALWYSRNARLFQHRDCDAAGSIHICSINFAALSKSYYYGLVSQSRDVNMTTTTGKLHQNQH